MNTIEIVTEPKEARRIVKDIGEKSSVLSEVDMGVFRGAPLYILRDPAGALLTLNVTYFGKKSKNIWEPYANWYTAYTPVAIRRKGYATELYKVVEAEAIKRGCKRIKSLAGTYAGMMMHHALGHLLWGITPEVRDEKGKMIRGREVCVDAPLIMRPEYSVGRIPGQVVQTLKESPYPPVCPVTPDEIVRCIAGSKLLRYDLQDLPKGFTCSVN